MKKEAYDPKCVAFPYPKKTDQHYLPVNRKYHFVFDENYPYIDKTKKFCFKKGLVRIVLVLIVFPYMRIRLGLKVKGRKNLKKHRDVIKQGVISCANHVHMFDYLAVLYAIRPYRSSFLSWNENVNGKSGKLVRLVGGIPIPLDNLKATKAYLNALKEFLNDGGWLHIYSEGSMWEYYKPIRPFKKGAATFSCKYNKPIISLGFSYRKPGFIRRKIFKQIACFTLTIGELLYPNYELDKNKQVDDLTERCHASVARCAKIDEKDNLYPPIFSDDIERIDYYASSYGEGYKGSH